MAVFRIERTRDYTVMSNHHLRNANLSLKAKGLLSMMLSLPEEWNYTTRGLAAICKEGVDAIGSALKELETAGYIVRRQLRGANGRITDTEYIIYEQPQPKKLDMLPSDVVSPDTENPDMVKPDTEKPAELNIEKSNTEKSITYGSSTDSIPFRETAAARPPERKGRDAMSVTEIENYRELILENIEYDCLKQRYPLYLDDLNEIVELLVETVCARRKTTRISGADFPHEIVRSRFLKLDSSHIEFVMDCLQKNTTQVRNMKQYLLTEEVEIRYRTETSTDPETGETTSEEVPYEYYILNVKLTSKPISAVASELLTPEQMEMYQVYRQTMGNKPLLFGGGSPDMSNSEDLTGVQFVNGTRPGNPQLVELAKRQVGNVGGYPYWSWYGFDSRVEWCACFVSWCYNQAGKSEPRFAGCEWQGVPWFQSHGQWGARGYNNLAPGDAIFFDWDLDGTADHVGIVIGTDGSRVYTVEGNSGDACKIKSYDLNYQSIKGYGLMNW